MPRRSWPVATRSSRAATFLPRSSKAWPALLPEKAANEIFGDRRSFVAGSIAASPSSKAVAASGGFLLTGHWTFGSFIGHSPWALATAAVFDGQAPRVGAGGAPDVRLFFFPSREAEIIDTWRVSGLKGTRSNDYRVEDLLVPEERTLPLFSAAARVRGPVYLAPTITVLSLCVAPVPLGIARSAIEAFVALAETQTPFMSPVRLREKARAQAALGQAEALVQSGRAFLLQAAEALWDELAAGRIPSLRHRAMSRLASAQAARNAAQAVDLLHDAAGSSALFESNPIERCFRDVHATTQHIGASANNFELCGSVLLGADPLAPL